MTDETYKDLVEIYEGHESAEDVVLIDSTLKLPEYTSCSCHKLSLIASTDSIRCAEKNKKFNKTFKSALSKLRSLWAKCKSTKVTDMFEERLGSKVITPNLTRWLSLYNSIDDFLKKNESNSIKLEEIFKDQEVKLPFPTKSEVECLKEFGAVMGPVNNALMMLQGDKDTYWAFLAPALRLVEKKLSKLTDLQYCEQLKIGVLNGIKERY